jgi:hypothetical protein
VTAHDVKKRMQQEGVVGRGSPNMRYGLNAWSLAVTSPLFRFNVTVH